MVDIPFKMQIKPNFVVCHHQTKDADLIVDSEYQMDPFAAQEEQLASQRMRQKLEEVNVAAQTNLAPVQDYVNFTLQVLSGPFL